MATEKNLITTKRFFGATPIDSFINLELTGERAFVKPSKTDNIIDLNEKFAEERNACTKFCIYGLLQSKWSDSDDIKIDFYIADSTLNINPASGRTTFWVYDKTTNISATTWSVMSRPLDNSSGDLSYNIYRRKKASYFFPFELDMERLPRNSDGIRTNKSIFVSIEQPSKNAYVFTGNGNWSDPNNWLDKAKPPVIVPNGYSVYIEPVAGGSCVLDINQQINPGAQLIVVSNSNLLMNGNLQIQ